jgi:transposase
MKRPLHKVMASTPIQYSIKILARQYNQTIPIRVKAKVQLNNLLDEIMPGIQTILRTTTENPNKILYDFVE